MNQLNFRRSTLAGAAVGIGIMLQAPGALAGVDLPVADCGLANTNTCLEFGDFTVYSLPYLQDIQKNNPGSPIYDSLQGLDLKFRVSEPELWVVDNNGTGTALQGVAQGQNPDPLIDDPYTAIQGSTNPGTPPNQDQNIDDNLLFLMTSSTFGGQFAVPSDPDGGPADDNVRQPLTTVNNSETWVHHDTSVNDPADYNNGCFTDLDGCLPLWDADVGKLSEALGDDRSLVFFFSNNETGDTGGLSGQDLNAWAQVCLTDTDGSAATRCFTLDGTGPGILPQQYDEQVAAQSDILPEVGDRWVHVHSDLCVLNDGSVLLGSCADQPTPVPPSLGSTLNQSLGQNEATFAVVNLELSDLVTDPNTPYDVLTIDFRLAYLNNGGDWLAIGASRIEGVNKIPEPGTLLLIGLGLAGLGARRLKQHQLS